MTDDCGMGEDHEIPRRELDRFYLERIDRLTERIETIEARVQMKLHDLEQKSEETRQILHGMTYNIQRIFDRQHEQEPALTTLHSVIAAGLVMKWIMVTVVGALAAIGTTATAWDIIRQWRLP